MNKPKVLTLRVTLNDVAPPIWRSFKVPDSLTLHQLHQVLQTVMGWSDIHLYSFQIKDHEYALPNEESPEEPIKPVSTPLAHFHFAPGELFEYMYDFGDWWQHQVLVEATEPAEVDLDIPRCLGGARNCPPENCGGFPGYEQLIEVLLKREGQEYQDLLDWLEEPYDPEFFSVEETNLKLKNR